MACKSCSGYGVIFGEVYKTCPDCKVDDMDRMVRNMEIAQRIFDRLGIAEERLEAMRRRRDTLVLLYVESERRNKQLSLELNELRSKGL